MTDWNGFKKNGTKYIPNDATARAGVIANTKLIKDTVGWSGKNKLPNNASTRTDNGITFTVNADGSITANGTATNDASNGWNAGKIKAGKYILSGCPANGSNSTYYIRIGTANSESDTWGSYLAEEIGNGRLITLEADTYLTINVRVMNGQTVNNLIFYPMLCDPDILDATAYESYHEDVVDTLREAEVIEGKNLLKPNWSAGTGTGITFTINADGTVRANGTASGDNTLVLPLPNIPADTDLILNGCPTGGSATTYFMQYTNEVDNAYNDFGSGVAIRKFNYTTYGNARVVIKIKSGQTVSNIVFKPMIRLATETDPTYEPYYIPLKDSMFPRSEQAVLGAENLFNPAYATSGSSDYYVPVYVGDNITVTLSSNMPKNSSDGANLFLLAGNVQSGISTATNGVWVDNPRTVTAVSGYITICSRNSGGVNPVDYNHMLNLGTVARPFVPYAMTNRELTEKVNAIDVSSDITINTEQTAYNITSLRVQRIGQLVMVTGDITSLTEDGVPQGRSFASIASLLPKPIIDVHAIILPKGSGNQAELYIVGNNSQLQMRGGTVNQAYQFTFTYITAS